MNIINIIDLLGKLTKAEVYFGPQGFDIARTEENLKEAQKDYDSNASDSFVSGTQGWASSWLVIARDTELGDPYFVDVAVEGLPVYTAMPENGVWQPELVSSSLQGFVDCLNLIEKAGNQQATPQFVPDGNTLSDKDALSTLHKALVKLSSSQVFWKMFFQCYDDWLEDEEL